MARQPAVTAAEPIEAAKIKINGEYAAVLGVDPSTFRGYAAPSTAASDPLWQGVAGGGVAVSYTMGTLDRLALGRTVTVTGRQAERLAVVAFGTVGIGGVDAVVSDSVARSLGMPASNAIVVSAPPEVAPLSGLRQADLLVVAPFSLSRHVLAAVSAQSGVTSADPIEAARITINGAQAAVLGVDPSTFRGYAAGPVAASDPLWRGVAGGGVAVSYTMGTLDRLALGRTVTVTVRPSASRSRVPMV